MIARKLSDPSELEMAKVMLKEAKLPTSDIAREVVSLYGFYEDEQLIGTGAIEYLNGYRLLRSLSVSKDQQSKGLGFEIIKFLEAEVSEEGIDQVFIITEIPEYFLKHEYILIPREQSPTEIKDTQEFSVLCPDTAVVMRKNLKIIKS